MINQEGHTYLEDHASYTEYRIYPEIKRTFRTAEDIDNFHETIANLIATRLTEKGWTITRPGKYDPLHTDILISASKYDSYLELKKPFLEVTKEGVPEYFKLIGGVWDILQNELQDVLNHEGDIQAQRMNTSYAPSITILSDQERINHYYQPDIHEHICQLICNAVANPVLPNDVESEVRYTIRNEDKKFSIYRPDQFWNTTQETKALSNILHQEIEGMKRNGLLKEDAHTGKLTVGKPIEQVVSR